MTHKKEKPEPESNAEAFRSMLGLATGVGVVLTAVFIAAQHNHLKTLDANAGHVSRESVEHGKSIEAMQSRLKDLDAKVSTLRGQVSDAKPAELCKCPAPVPVTSCRCAAPKPVAVAPVKPAECPNCWPANKQGVRR